MSPDTAAGRPGFNRSDWLLLLGVAVSTSIWCMTAGRQLGPTVDESFYVSNGLEFWRTGNRVGLMAAGAMPLSTHLQTFLLWATEHITGYRWVWDQDVAAMLAVARSATLFFWWLFLFYVMRLGHAIGGVWTGRLAVLLLGFDPNFLAHAGLATTDLSLAACLMLFTFHYRAGQREDWQRRVLVPGVLFGLVVLAKASALLFGPLAMVLVEVERHTAARANAPAWWPSRRLVTDALVILLIGVGLAVLYCGSGGQPSFQTTLARMSLDHPLRPLLAWFSALPLFPNALYAIYYQLMHNAQGHATYLIGYESAKGLWFYLPVMLAIKVPLATLAVLAASFIVPGGRLKWLSGFLIVGLGLALIMRVDIGVRLVLPLLALTTILVLSHLTHSANSISATAQRAGAAALAVAVAWLIVSDLRIWPDAIRYTNEASGNTDNGYLNVTDSNYDWGQGLPELAQWQAERSARVNVWQFGDDPRFPSLTRFDPHREPLDAAIPPGGVLAVGTSHLYGGYSTDGPERTLVQRLRLRTPIARTRTFLIFGETTP